MEKFKWFLVFILLVIISGCGNTKALTTLYNSSGEVVATLSGAAIQRDFLYMDRGKHRDTIRQEMHDNAGIKTKYKMVKINGTMAWLPSEITIRPLPHFQQTIETRPPDHRGWDSLDNIVNKGATGWLAWLLKEGYASATDKNTVEYRGPYNNQVYNQSFNPVTDPLQVVP